MGFTPQQVDAMSMWEFGACSTGYAEAHGMSDKPKGEGMTEDRMRDLGIL